MELSLLKTKAQDALSGARYDPKRLSLLYTGAALLLSLLTTLVSYLLTRQVDSTGGLRGLGARTMLQTAQVLLTVAGAAVIPFWDLGYLRAALCTARGQDAKPPVLLEGFRRFGVSLRLLLLRTLLVVLMVMVCAQAASFLFMLSPFSLSFMEQAQQLLTTTNTADITQAQLESLLQAAYPMYFIFGALLLAVLIPLLYRLRLADWAVMDEAAGALAAMRLSSRSMKGNCLQLFRVDLHFWWYYLLSALAAALAFGDLLLPFLGLELDADVGMWIFYLASLATQLAIGWLYLPRVQTVYAAAYDVLCTDPTPPPKPVPQNLPWS